LSVLKRLRPGDLEELARRVLAVLLNTTENDSVQRPGGGSSVAPPASVSGATDDQNGSAVATPSSHSDGPTDGATHQKAMESVDELWERFKETVMGRVAVLEQTTMALLEGTLDDDLRQHAQREAHKLVGSVGLFGFSRGTELAREIEHALLQEANLDQHQVLRLSQMVAALRQELEKGAPRADMEPGASATSDDQARDGDGVDSL